MRRTTVYLDEETALAIRQLADIEKRSQAEIIRDALSTYIEQAKRRGDRPIPTSIGAYRSGRSDVSEEGRSAIKRSSEKKPMTLVADSGALYALYDADDAYHAPVRQVIEQERGVIIIPATILAEIDYLLREFLGVDAELAFLDGIAGGAYTLEPLTIIDLSRCRELIATYRDLAGSWPGGCGGHRHCRTPGHPEDPYRGRTGFPSGSSPKRDLYPAPGGCLRKPRHSA